MRVGDYYVVLEGRGGAEVVLEIVPLGVELDRKVRDVHVYYLRVFGGEVRVGDFLFGGGGKEGGEPGGEEGGGGVSLTGF